MRSIRRSCFSSPRRGHVYNPHIQEDLHLDCDRERRQHDKLASLVVRKGGVAFKIAVAHLPIERQQAVGKALVLQVADEMIRSRIPT